MRRTANLQNHLYRQKYREIYKIVFSADLDTVKDHSQWMEKGTIFHPLWIIIESKILNKRIWVTHSLGSFEITTAQLDLDVKSSEYSNSYVRYPCRNQKEMCEKLKEVFAPCLEKEQEQEQDLEIDM